MSYYTLRPNIAPFVGAVISADDRTFMAHLDDLKRIANTPIRDTYADALADIATNFDHLGIA